jgi:hypothetical protein
MHAVPEQIFVLLVERSADAGGGHARVGDISEMEFRGIGNDVAEEIVGVEVVDFQSFPLQNRQTGEHARVEGLRGRVRCGLYQRRIRIELRSQA